MALSWKSKRRWSLFILVVGLPVYVVAAVTLVNWAERQIGRPVMVVELLIYAVLGILWALPFKRIFKGVGRADPEAGENSGQE